MTAPEPPDNKWKIVKGEDGKEYFEVNAQVMIPQNFDPSQGGVLCPNPLVDTSPPVLLGTVGGMSVFSDATMRAGEAFVGLATPPGLLSAPLWSSPPKPEPDPEPEPSGRFENLDFG